jgi:hypothetical protein
MPPRYSLEKSLLKCSNLADGESSSSFDVNSLPKLPLASLNNADGESSSSFDVNILPKLPRASLNDEVEQTKKTEKSVKFSKIVKFRRIPHFADMSKEEKNRLWIPRDVLRKIKRCCREIVLQLDSGDEMDSNKLGDIDLGLHRYRQPQYSKRKESRSTSNREVFFLQEFQLDLFDLYGSRGAISKLIAVRYSNLSTGAQEEAQLRASENACAVLSTVILE